MDERGGALARLDAMEARIAHQDLAIEELNGALTRQWHEIDALVRRVASLTERLQEVATAGSPPNDNPPPHY